MYLQKCLQKFSLVLIVSTLLINSSTVFAEDVTALTKQLCKIDKCDPELAFEINDLQEELQGAEGFINTLKQLEIVEASITKAIQKLDELLQKGNETLTKMLEKVSTTLIDEEALDEYWDILENLEEAADDQAEYVMEYVEKYPELMKKFENLMPQMSMMEKITEDFEEMDDSEDDDDDDDDSDDGEDEEDDDNKADIFEDFFTDFSGKVFSPLMMDLSQSEKMIGNFLQDMKIGSEVFTHVMRKVSDDLKIELAKYLEDDFVGEIMGHLMENMEVFGKEFTNELIKNQTNFLKQFDEFYPPDIIHFEEGDKAAELYGRSRQTIIPKKFVEQLSKLWNEIFTEQDKDEKDRDEDKINKNLKEVEEILTQVNRENVLGEKPIEFFDVSFEEQPWYWEPVMVVRNQGIINGYRDAQGPTGFFGPNNNLTYAEALKMILETADHHPETSENAEIWYQAYLDKLDELKLNRLNSKTFSNWNAPAKRKDIIIMINEVFGLEPIEYIEGTFPDLKADDPLADDAMAAYFAEIFTGEGGTGNLNPNGNINRASFAKVINVAMEHFDQDNFLERLEDFEQNIEKENSIGEKSIPSI